MGRIKTHLKEATKNYATFQNETGINGISILDADIISNIIDIIVKLNADKNLIKLIEAYKQIPDQDFLSLIESYNDSFEGNILTNDFFINIKDKFIGSIGNLYSFTRYSKYDSKIKCSIPILLINKTENVKIPYANTEIKFNDEDELDKVFFEIKEKLEKHTNIIFI